MITEGKEVDTNEDVDNSQEAPDGDNQEAQAEEQEARSMGWRPEEEWEGPKGKWIDAKTFLERGNQIMPILRANNKKMREELLTRDKQFSKLQESLEVANRSLATLRKGYDEATKKEVQLAIDTLKEQFKQARDVGDVDLELQVKRNLDKLEAKADKLADEDTKDNTPPDNKEVQLSPEFVEWQEKNKWFGNAINPTDRQRTRALINIGEQLRAKGETAIGIAFMDKCMEVLKEKEEGYSRKSSKVESPNSGGKGGGGRKWDSLPKDAKTICHEDNETFVGPGKMFKTVKEWEDHYANLYSE